MAPAFAGRWRGCERPTTRPLVFSSWCSSFSTTRSTATSGRRAAACARMVSPCPLMMTSQHSRSEILGLCSSEKWTSARSKPGQRRPRRPTFSSVRALISSDTIFLPCAITTSTCSPPWLCCLALLGLVPGPPCPWSDRPLSGCCRELRAADLVFDPTLACGENCGRAPAAPTVSGGRPFGTTDGTRHLISALPRQPGATRAGLTPKPHHAQQPRVALRGSFRLRLASTCNHRPARSSRGEVYAGDARNPGSGGPSSRGCHGAVTQRQHCCHPAPGPGTEADHRPRPGESPGQQGAAPPNPPRGRSTLLT